MVTPFPDATPFRCAVSLELNPPVAGGGRWIALQSRFALAELRRRLVAREAPLVELIRDAESDTPGVDLVVAWRLEDELNLGRDGVERRSEEHTSELQSLMRISYAVFCLKKKN